MSSNGAQVQGVKMFVADERCSPSILLPEKYPTAIQKYTSCRWRLCYMLTFVLMFSLILRNCMSFAIVCMTGEVIQVKGENSHGPLHSNSSSANSSEFLKVYTGEFDYSSEIQGLLISSSSYASIISPLVGGFCSRKFGPKRVIFIFMALSGVTILVSPMAARTHLYMFIACRVITGFFANTVLPPTFDLWLYWAPAEEKAQLVAYSFAGYSLSVALQNLISGLICIIPVDNGWPFIFYVFGGCTLVWCGLWHLTVFESPELHPRITKNEKKYIIMKRTTHDKKVPWKSIALSKPVWAYFLVFFCHDWTTAVIFGFLPLYMATVLNFDVTKNGLLSSLPSISRTLATVFWGYLSVRLTRMRSVTQTRKVIQCGGFFVAAGLSVSLCYLEEGQEYLAVIIFIIATPFQAVTINSAIITPLDMAPQYAAIISSAGMSFSCLSQMLAPLAVSYMITERRREQWAVVFYSNAGILGFGAIVFLLFGSGELQTWAAERTTHSVKKITENVSNVPHVDQITHM